MKFQYSLLAATALCVALPRDLQKRQAQFSDMGQPTDSFGSTPATSGDQASFGFDSGTSSMPEPMVMAGNDDGLTQPATFPETTTETFDSSSGPSSQEFPSSTDPMMMGATDNGMVTDTSTFADPMNPMDSEMVESQFTDDFGAVTGKPVKAKKSTKKTSKKTPKKATTKSSKKVTPKKGSTKPKKTNAAAKPKATHKPKKVAAQVAHA